MTTSVAHLFTYRYPPAGGGLEVSVERIAGLLAATGTITPIVYVRAYDATRGDAEEWNGIVVRPLGRDRRARGLTLDDDAMLLQHAIATNAGRYDASARHVIISFYAAQEGPIGDQAASALQMPHIIAIRGSDYSYGFHEPVIHSLLRQVLPRAARITTTNDEQTRAVRDSMGLQNVTRIHNALPDAIRNVRHAGRSHDGTVRMFADSGYSFKKGTIILLNAFAELCREGLPVTLTIAGSEESGNSVFWRNVREDFTRRLGDRIRLHGRIDADSVRTHLLSSDVYCSATLGEGCSLARSAAMVAGIPIVSTNCGELADLASDIPHVRLAQPADAGGFLEALRDMCAGVLTGRVMIDISAVERWRHYFRPEREQEEWRACIDWV